jgi:hypothetical protein
VKRLRRDQYAPVTDTADKAPPGPGTRRNV